MLGLSSCRVTTTGSLRCSELIIVASISGGAEKAIEGAVVKARSPLRFENDFLKSLLLEENQLQEYTS